MLNPYHQNPQDLQPLVGGTVKTVGVSREGIPYLIVQQGNTTFYVLAQSDAEGNSFGFLNVTERSYIPA